MTEDKDDLGETLRPVERAQENICFQKRGQALVDQMHHKDVDEIQETAEATRLRRAYATILVPVDFSAPSTEALLQAASIAERFHSSLVVLHVVSRGAHRYAVEQHLGLQTTTMCGVFLGPKVLEISNELAEAMGRDLLEQAYIALRKLLFPLYARIPLEMRVVIGHPVKRIVETAAHDKVDLIVMGSHGHTSLIHRMIGNVTERVARLAPCAVLTVKTATAEEKSWIRGFYATFHPPTPYRGWRRQAP
jgi:nucleotide-binding universal stress UspA family protein